VPSFFPSELLLKRVDHGISYCAARDPSQSLGQFVCLRIFDIKHSSFFLPFFILPAED
jgi:hypothetical protein